MMQSSHAIICHTDNNVKDKKAVSTMVKGLLNGNLNKNANFMNKLSNDYAKTFSKTTNLSTTISLLKSIENDHINTIGKKMLSDTDIRSMVNIAASYAGYKMGLAGRSAVYSTYQKGEKCEEIEKHMVHALVARGCC